MTSFDWTRLNATELALVAKEFNPEAQRWLPFEVLVTIIEDEGPHLPQRFIHKRRLAVMQHINEHWEGMDALINCPAKTRDPLACFGCSDVQAACCSIDNANRLANKE